MDIPARPLDLAGIKPIPVEPEPVSGFIFDAVIVTRGLCVLASAPFHGYAFRPLGAHDTVKRAAPAEFFRWAVRHFGHDLDRLRARKKPKRPARRFSFAAHRDPFLFQRLHLLGRKRDSGRFRNVRVLGRKGEDAGRTEARGKPIDEEGDLLFGIVVGKAMRRLFLALGMNRFEANEIEAEPWIERIGKRVETFTKETKDDLRIARGSCSLDGDRAYTAVGSEEDGL